jgi:hypothetical protein
MVVPTSAENMKSYLMCLSIIVDQTGITVVSSQVGENHRLRPNWHLHSQRPSTSRLCRASVDSPFSLSLLVAAEDFQQNAHHAQQSGDEWFGSGATDGHTNDLRTKPASAPKAAYRVFSLSLASNT